MVVAVVPRPAGTHDDGPVARLRPRRRKKGGSAEGKRGLQRSGMLLLRGFLRPSSSPLAWAAPSTGCPCSHRFRFPSPPLWTALRSVGCTNLASGRLCGGWSFKRCIYISTGSAVLLCVSIYISKGCVPFTHDGLWVSYNFQMNH